MLLKGNPATIECLWTDRWVDVSRELDGLVEMRDEFINATSLKQYIGYAHGQLQRLKAGTRLHSSGGEYNTKWAYHLIRVLLDGKRIAHGEPPLVYKAGEELDLLMSIRRGEWTPDQIANYAGHIEEDIDALKPWPIPEEANKKRLNEWFIALRYGIYE